MKAFFTTKRLINAFGDLVPEKMRANTNDEVDSVVTMLQVNGADVKSVWKEKELVGYTVEMMYEEE